MRQIVVTQTGVGTSKTLPLDIHGRPQITLQVVATGTVNWTVEQTDDNVFDGSITPTWFDHPDTSNMVAQTTSKQNSYAYVPAATRIKVNSGTGSVTYTIIQSGITG